jgi:hypothetical protein
MKIGNPDASPPTRSMLSPMSSEPNSASTFPERPQSVNPDTTAHQPPRQRLGDLLAEVFDRLPLTPEDGDFERPPQGDHQESPSFDE